MRKLIIQDADIMKLAIQNEISRSEDARYDHRLHGVLLACEGLSSYDISNLLGDSARAVEYWINRFEKSGFAGLREGEKTGRPPKVDEELLYHLGKDLRKSPRDFKYTQTLWDGKLLSYHLDQTYNIELGVRQSQRLFTTLGFRRRKPRPVIAHADKTAQDDFKKTTKKRRSR